MIGTRRHLMFIALMGLFTLQLAGTAWFNDRLPQWSDAPLHTQKQLPGQAGGETEADGDSENESLFLLASGSGSRVVPLLRRWDLDNRFCPRCAYDSELFRPPARS